MAVKLLLDTSAYSAFNRGDARLKSYFQSTNTLILPLIVIGELRAGFAVGSRQRTNERLLQRFIDSPNVEIVPLSMATTQHFAAIYSELRRQGTPIGTNDIWIASLSREHSLELLTLDKDFKNIQGLSLTPLT